MLSVTPYDIGRFLVRSESGDGEYLVDVLRGGGCDCPDYRIRVDGLKQKTSCKHLDAAIEVWCRDFSPDERAEMARQQSKPKRDYRPFMNNQ